MKLLKSKYKIYKQTNENLWNKFALKRKKTKKKQWKSFFNKFFPKHKKNISINKFSQNKESLKKYYKLKMLEKKKFKSFYNFLTEKQLINYLIKIEKKHPIQTYNYLCQHLESRLDVILFRLDVFKNIYEITQNVQHKKIKVNNKIVKTISFILKPGDIISFDILPHLIKKKFKLTKLNYIFTDKINQQFIFLRQPKFEEINHFFILDEKIIMNSLHYK